VRQWRFQPVIRNGHAVNAYTDATVTFFDPRKPFEGEDAIGGSLADDLAEAKRILELENRFPRSPEQVLADLERDRGNAVGFLRDMALPELAKAALAAGALEKAAGYANEMLAGDPHSPNYGQSVHDGNMVRGLVALRQGNINQAAHDLLAAGKTSGSAVLDSFGPNESKTAEPDVFPAASKSCAA